jgi:hypothetical protein
VLTAVSIYMTAMTAKSSASMRPVLMKLYHKNMSAYQQALTNFIKGYREGAAEKVDLSGIFASLGTDGTSEPISPSQSGKTAPPGSSASKPINAKHAESSERSRARERNSRGAAETGSGLPGRILGSKAAPASWEEAVSSSDPGVGTDDQNARSLYNSSETSTPQTTGNFSGRQHDTEIRAASADAPPSKDGRKVQELTASSRAESNEVPSGPDPQNGRQQSMLDNLVSGFRDRGLRGGKESREDGRESNLEVLKALDDAERLAAGFVGGAMTPAERQDLVAAIERAEAAMSKGTRVLDATKK